jgi:predicted secreted protein
MGAPGVEILVLAVTQPGTYNIRMDYKRSWEKMSLQSFNFTVIAE